MWSQTKGIPGSKRNSFCSVTLTGGPRNSHRGYRLVGPLNASLPSQARLAYAARPILASRFSPQEAAISVFTALHQVVPLCPRNNGPRGSPRSRSTSSLCPNCQQPQVPKPHARARLSSHVRIIPLGSRRATRTVSGSSPQHHHAKHSVGPEGRDATPSPSGPQASPRLRTNTSVSGRGQWIPPSASCFSSTTSGPVPQRPAQAPPLSARSSCVPHTRAHPVWARPRLRSAAALVFAPF
ncbi:hypothetical protein NDU88_005266 [Pleurodeles waltl]|uniref:Uncharacterized protein n=1 Tax=Pleurodeles waltl TaxID=8319 RepID=A0AAV7TTS4_PLEWA|nr:hypothetical protein NDU88_005266 [Pleurodeles waltl]